MGIIFKTNPTFYHSESMKSITSGHGNMALDHLARKAFPSIEEMRQKKYNRFRCCKFDMDLNVGLDMLLYDEEYPNDGYTEIIEFLSYFIEELRHAKDNCWCKLPRDHNLQI